MATWKYTENGKCTRDDKDELHLSRVRDTKTSTEILRIEVKACNTKKADATETKLDTETKTEAKTETKTENAAPKCIIDCDFLTWESEIKAIARYGIYFDSGDRYQIKNIIKNNFADIPVLDDESQSTETEELFNMYCELIKENLEGDKSSTVEGQSTVKDSEIVMVKDDLYGITLTAFEEHLKGSTSKISAKDLRAKFLDKEFIECNPMRTDKVIKDKNNKPVRCVAFKKVLVDKYNSGIK